MTTISRRDTLRAGFGAGALAVLSATPVRAQSATRVSFVLTNDISKMAEEKGIGGFLTIEVVVVTNQPHQLFGLNCPQSRRQEQG
jgi:hypothetical protein